MLNNNKMGRLMTRIVSVFFIVYGVASFVFFISVFLLSIRELIMVGVDGTVEMTALSLFANVIYAGCSVVMYLAGKKGFVAANEFEEYRTIYFWGKLHMGTIVLRCILKGIYTSITKEDAMIYAYFYILLFGATIIYMYGGKLNSRLVNSEKDIRFKKMI